MSLEAKIISTSKPGEAVNILVSYSDAGREITRETLVFPASQVLDEASVRLRINEVGSRISASTNSEVFVGTLVGRTFPVEPVVPSVPIPGLSLG